MRDINKQIQDDTARILYDCQWNESLYKIKTGLESFTLESLALYFKVSEEELLCCKDIVTKMLEGLNNEN